MGITIHSEPAVTQTTAPTTTSSGPVTEGTDTAQRDGQASYMASLAAGGAESTAASPPDPETEAAARLTAQRMSEDLQSRQSNEVIRGLNQTVPVVRASVDVYNAEFNTLSGEGLIADINQKLNRVNAATAMALLDRAGIAGALDAGGPDFQTAEEAAAGDQQLAIVAEPALPVAMPGTRVTYRITHAEHVTSGRFQYAWHCLNDANTSRTRGAPARVSGPASETWEAQWDFVGTHRLVCQVIYVPRGQAPDPPVVLEYRQTVVSQLDRAEAAFAETEAGSDPAQSAASLRQYMNIVNGASEQEGSSEVDAEQMEQLEEYVEAMDERLESTNGQTRVPIRAVHVEVESGRVTPLNVFVAQMPPSGGLKRFKVVDVTNPADRRLTGEYSGSGATDQEALDSALSDWDSDNRYPPGILRLQVPSQVLGDAYDHTIQTDGSSFWDSVADFFNTVGLVAGVAAIAGGIITAIAPVPGSRAVSALIWTSIIAGTAGAAVNIAQRHAEGFSNAREDALDVLTIAGCMLGAGSMWAMGARVTFSGASGVRMTQGFIVGQVAADGATGVILSVELLGQYNEIMEMTDPQARTDALLGLLGSAATTGAIIVIGMNGARSDLDGLQANYRRLADPGDHIDLNTVRPDAQTPASTLDEAAGASDVITRRQALMGGQTEAAIAARQADDAARFQEIAGSGQLDSHGFHGTSSDMLDGLATTDGQLMPASMLDEQGVPMTTGEGDTFSGRAGAKTFISIGEGTAGMGTSLAYADAVEGLTHYNPRMYGEQELADEISRLELIVRHYDDLDQPLADNQMVRHMAYRDKGQFESRLARLQEELAIRESLPAGHPGRAGGVEAIDDYPLLFEFDMDGLDARSAYRPDDALAGEASVHGPIDLRERLVRVYAPSAFIPDATSRLQAILGHSNFEVISMESVGGALPSAGTASRGATYSALEEIQGNFDNLSAAYETAIREGRTIDMDLIFSQMNNQ